MQTPLRHSNFDNNPHITHQSSRRRHKPGTRTESGKPHPILLHVAVRDNDVAWVRQLLENGVKTNVVEYLLHRHPLHLSIRQGNLEITRLLLEYGACPDIADRWKNNWNVKNVCAFFNFVITNLFESGLISRFYCEYDF